MGGFLSLAKIIKSTKIPHTIPSKNERLIPDLPDEITLQILARLPRICYIKFKPVSRKWRETLMDTDLFKLRKQLKTTEEWLYILTQSEDDKLLWRALDPLSGTWIKLPPMPHTTKISDKIGGWLWSMQGYGEVMTHGFSSATVEGCLYVLGGFSGVSSMNCVWKYDPIFNTWQEVRSMSVGRAYCKTGTLHNKLYAVAGMNLRWNWSTHLTSAEVFDPDTGSWTELPNMPTSAAADFLFSKSLPKAIDMTSFRGALCVPQLIGGVVYYPDTNSWTKMLTGMSYRWPAKQSGRNLSIVVNDEMYALDPFRPLRCGKVRVYDETQDIWKFLLSKEENCGHIDSGYPYLLAGINGGLHVVTKDEGQRIVVLRAELYDRNFRDIFDVVVWKIVANSDFACSSLISCQTLEL